MVVRFLLDCDRSKCTILVGTQTGYLQLGRIDAENGNIFAEENIMNECTAEAVIKSGLATIKSNLFLGFESSANVYVHEKRSHSTGMELQIQGETR